MLSGSFSAAQRRPPRLGLVCQAFNFVECLDHAKPALKPAGKQFFTKLHMIAAQVFPFFCLAFVGGIVFSSITQVPQVIIWGTLVCGIALVSVFWKKEKRIVVVGFCLFVFAAGLLRHQMFEQPKERVWGAVAPQTLSFLSPAREKLGASIDRFLSPPHSSILGAMMLGENERLSSVLKKELNRSGTRHITAISGMHIIILANMLIGLGLFWGLWRGQAFYFALITITLFIIMVGAPPSAVRAGIMGGLVLCAEKMGRISQAKRLLVIAGTLMLAINPLLLKFDIGFQLSFAATLGISMLSSWFLEKLSFVPTFFQMRSIAAMTIPAVIFTAPILAYHFGQVSLISLVTNLFVVPPLSLLLGMGFLAGIVGIFSSVLGPILFGPVWLILSYMYNMIHISSGVPFAAVGVSSFPWYGVVFYFILLFWGIRHWKMDV